MFKTYFGLKHLLNDQIVSTNCQNRISAFVSNSSKSISVSPAEPTGAGPAHVHVHELQHARLRRHGGDLRPDQDPPEAQSAPQPLHALRQVCPFTLRFIRCSFQITVMFECLFDP